MSGYACRPVHEVGNILSYYSYDSIEKNPVNNEARPNYSLDQPDQIRIALYNLSGQLVITLYQGSRNAGEHSLTFSNSNIPPGMYFCSIEGKMGRVSRKVIVGGR